MASFIEDVAAAKQAKAEKDNPTVETVEEKGPTLEEIQKDPEQSRLFGMYLEAQGGGDLAVHLLNKELTDDDLDVLRERRKGFLETEAVIEATEKKLDIKTITKLAEISPDLKKLAALRSPEAIREALVAHLSEVAITEPARFEKIKWALEDIDAAQSRMNEDSDEMVKLAAKYGFTKEQYKALLVEQDENPLAIEKALYGKVGKLKSLFVRAKTIEDNAAELDKRADIARAMTELEELNVYLGSTLKDTLLNTDTMRKEYLNALSGEAKEKKVPDMTFAEATKMKNAELTKDEVKDIRQEWDAYYKRYKDDFKDDFVGARKDFASEYVKKQIKKKGGGFWAFIAHMFMAPKIEKNLAGLK